MTAYRFNDAWSGAPEAYQDYILPLVSRTFALTIPQLPAGLRSVVANAYLLCRIADTIEDEPALGADDKRRFEEDLAAVVAGRLDAGLLADTVVPRLSQQTLESERDLMRQLPLVIEVLRSFRPAQQSALLRCVTVMGRGMHRFQRSASLLGLADQREMDRYCYYVAGVVGEMLTELFCDFDPVMASRREPMMRLAVSFGQALQMTNILTDQWEDRARGACWLPRSVFEASGVNLDGLQAGQRSEGYARALTELIGVAHAHIRNGLDYTLMVPAQHSGIRRFCLWSLGLAILTLKNLHRHPEFAGATEIKVSPAAVARTIMITNLAVRRDAVLRRLFEYAGRDLPLTDLGPDWSRKKTLPVTWVIENGGAAGRELAAWPADPVRASAATDDECADGAALIDRAGGRAWASEKANRRVAVGMDAAARARIAEGLASQLRALTKFLVDREA